MRAWNLKTTYTAALVTAATLAASISPRSDAFAQAAPQASPAKPAPPVPLRSYLNTLDYDAAERGPLLVVAPDEKVKADPDLTAPESATRLPLTTLARFAGRKVVRIGEVTVLVPLTMKVIESNPGTANPFRGMNGNVAIQLLMGSFTTAQWQIACSPGGIGLNDLKDDQKPLLENLLPDTLLRTDFQKIPGSPEGSYKIGSMRQEPISDPGSVRLRLNLLASYSTLGESGISGGGGRQESAAGKAVVRPMKARLPDARDDFRTSAYGVTLVKMVPNRQKPSQIDYESVILNPRILLGDLGRGGAVCDIIKRVAAAAHLDIVPDRRVSALPVFVRGDYARAGDLLQAIALAVTGTYRRVGATSAYVLTSDIEGNGTRVTRLEAWADRAKKARDKLASAAIAHAVKLNPLAYLAFAPDDPFTLPAGLTESLCAEYRAGAYEPKQTMRTADLPDAFRADINRKADRYTVTKGAALDTSKVRLGLEASMTFLIPGNEPFVNSTRAAYDLRLLAYVEPTGSAKPDAPAPLDWSWLKAPNQRRVLLVAPQTAADATKLVSSAAERGFTDIWLRVDPNTSSADKTFPDAKTLLQAAVTAGHRANISVAADLLLLKSASGSGEPERNIFGQTGDEFADALSQQQSAAADDEDPAARAAFREMVREQYAGWRSASSEDLMRSIESAAATPGLSGVVLQATAPPGFFRAYADGEDDQTGGGMGFTDARRAMFLHRTGIDPIDVRNDGQTFYGLDLSLPFFPDDGESNDVAFDNGKVVVSKKREAPQTLWNDARETENKQLMRDVASGVHDKYPALPLWIDDRTSDLTDVLSWFGTLDDPARLPIHVLDSEASAIDAARSASKTALRGARPPKTGPFATRSAEFISLMGAKAAGEKWDGIVVDCHDRAAEDVLLLLQAMPSRPPHGDVSSSAGSLRLVSPSETAISSR